jgi:hypothetical protein
MVFSEQRALQIGANQICRRGQAIYESHLRGKLDTPENRGRFLALDTETGDYDVGSRLDAGRTLRERNLDALIYRMKIGCPAAFKRGGSLLPMPR